jgi:GxxExxY protein
MEPQNTQNTQMDTGEDRVNLLAKRIIGCALTVLHTLGTGFLEKVYENALVHELRESGLAVAQQHSMVVRYDGIVVGEYTVDLLVEHLVLVELKVARAIDEIHRALPCNSACYSTSASLALRSNASSWPCRHRRPLRVLRDLRFHFPFGRADRAAGSQGTRVPS